MNSGLKTSFNNLSNPLSLGKILANARRACDMTQQELCNKTGIAYSTLTKIERGAIKKPNFFTVSLIAQATNLNIEDLLNQRHLDGQNTPTEISYKKTSLSGIEFVFFDIHQTLINSTSSILSVFSKKFNAPLYELEDLFLRYDKQLCLGQISLDDFDAILSKKFNIKDINWQQTYLQLAVPDPNVIDACLWTMKHYRVGILTNAFLNNSRNLIKHGIIPNGFEAVVDSSEIGLVKPYKDIYKYAQKVVNLEPGKILLVDDRKINIDMAEVCGWHGYKINTQNTINTLNDLQKILEF